MRRIGSVVVLGASLVYGLTACGRGHGPAGMTPKPRTDPLTLNGGGLDLVEDLRLAVAAHGLERPDETLSLEAVIGGLPADLRASYTLVRQSGSQQEGDAENPRAILFGRDARVVATFNGREGQAQFHRLELAKVTDTDHLELFAVDFPGEAPGGTDVRFSGPNPAECTVCHGAGPHYLWGSYPTWRGVYGEDSDAVLPGSDEAKAFALYQAVRATHPRYRYLGDAPPRPDPVAPYRPVHTGGLDQSTYFKNVEYRPNLRLGQWLGRRQSRAMAARLRESPRYGALRDLFTFVLTGCDLPPDLAPSERARVYARLATASGQPVGGNSAAVEAAAVALGARAAAFLQVPSLDADQEPPDGYYYDGFATARSYLLPQVWADVGRAHPALAGLFRPIPLGLVLGPWYSESAAGQAFWREADALAPASTCLDGCAPDLRAVLKRSDFGLSPAALGTACRALAAVLPDA